MTIRFGGEGGREGSDRNKEEEPEEPSFALSGKLTAETNTYRVRFHFHAETFAPPVNSPVENCLVISCPHTSTRDTCFNPMLIF